MEVIAVTGVEDQLQPEVRTTLERLHHAGIKVWMLTGDKVCACILHALFYHMYTHNGVGTGDDACDLIRVYLLQACICVAFWYQKVWMLAGDKVCACILHAFFLPQCTHGAQGTMIYVTCFFCACYKHSCSVICFTNFFSHFTLCSLAA